MEADILFASKAIDDMDGTADLLLDEVLQQKGPNSPEK
jgi:hypothetical protein